MDDVKIKLEPVDACGKTSGVVAYMRMPIPLSSMKAMNRFVQNAYGKDCVCTEEPKGWLQISTPEEKENLGK